MNNPRITSSIALTLLLVTSCYQPMQAAGRNNDDINPAALVAAIACLGGAALFLSMIFDNTPHTSSPTYTPAPQSRPTTYAPAPTREEKIKAKIAEARARYNQKIDRLCDTNNQSYADQTDINKLKSTIFATLERTIRANEYVSESTLNATVRNITATHIGNNAYYYARNAAYSWNSNAINPEQLAKAKGEQVADEVIIKYDSNRAGILREYLPGILNQRMQQAVREAYQTYDAPPSYEEAMRS